MSASDIPFLLDQFVALVDSPRNVALQSLWCNVQPPYDKFRDVPKPGTIPIIADLNAPLVAEILGFNVGKFYTDPDTYLEYYLRWHIFQFMEIRDDSALYKKIPIWLSVPFEDSLFGLQPFYSDTEDPWVGRDPILLKEEDLDRLPAPDFHTSGLMPLAHRFYEQISEQVQSRDFTVGFPQFRRGFFGVATHLRGLEALLIDTLERPEFVHRLLHFLLDSQKRYWAVRQEFLGSDRMEGYIADDEVNVPSISPRIYQDYLWSGEKELGKFCGGFTGYHSCGNLTPVLPFLQSVPISGTLHVSPWTDLARALDLFPTTALDIALNPAEDILRASPQKMEARYRQIMGMCQSRGAHAYYIRAGSLHPMETLNEDLAHIRNWVDIGLRLSEEFMSRN